MRAIVYIDGFNLYFGALEKTKYKWLDVVKFSQGHLPEGSEIVAVKYFTARIHPLPFDASAPTRQEFYLRAIATCPCLTIIYGHFKPKRRPMVMVKPNLKFRGGPFRWISNLALWIAHWAKTKEGFHPTVMVKDMKEKGSDVNLATEVLSDGYTGKYDLAAIISGDSDLLAPIRVVTTKLAKQVLVINPQTGHAKELAKAATKYRHIDLKLLPDCQLPPSLSDRKGIIRKPEAW